MAQTGALWASRAPRLGHVPAFDGLRGIGILLVLMGHAMPTATHSFAAIIDLFFVLSGFLITTLLLEEHRSTGGIRLGQFYARRTLRLMPALWVLLCLTVLIGVALDSVGRLSPEFTMKGLWVEVASGATYVHNLIFPAFNGTWMAHLWTLGVEEQFYLTIGVVVVVALRRGRVRSLTIGLAALMIGLMLWRLSGITGPFRWVTLVAWLQRPDSLLAGVITALISAQLPTDLPARLRRILPFAALTAALVLIGTILVSTGFTERHFPGIYVEAFPQDIEAGTVVRGYWMNWGFALGSLSSSVLAFCAFRLGDWSSWNWLKWRPLSWTGAKLSYSLYLLHVPVLIVLVELFSPDGVDPLVELPRWAFVALAMILPFGLAYPCYRLVEIRALRLRSRFGFREGAPAPRAQPEGRVFGAELAPVRPRRDPVEAVAVSANVARRRRSVGWFLLATYAMTIVAVFARANGLTETQASLVAAVGIAAGLVVGLGLVAGSADRDAFRAGWSPSLLRPIAFVFMAIPVLCHFVGVDVVGAMSDSASLGLTVDRSPIAVLAFVVVQLIFSVVEEAGWRGFLLPRLLIDRSPLRATAIVSLAWLAWFAPVFAGGDVTAVDVAFFAVTIFAMSVVQTALWHRSGGSILAAVGLHFVWSMTNLVGGGGLEVFKSLAMWVVAGAFIVVTKGRLWTASGASDASEPRSGLDLRFARVPKGLTGLAGTESREGAGHG